MESWEVLGDLGLHTPLEPPSLKDTKKSDPNTRNPQPETLNPKPYLKRDSRLSGFGVSDSAPETESHHRP